MIFLFGKKKMDKKNINLPESNFSISQSTMPVKKDNEGIAEDIRLIVAEWLKEIHVRFKTRYTKRQVRGITKIEPTANKYNVKCLNNMLLVFRIAKLSEEGQSSKELVDILKQRIIGYAEEKTTISKEGVSKFFD